MTSNESNLRQSLRNISDIYHWVAGLVQVGLDPALGKLPSPLERPDNNITRLSSRSLSQPDGWLCWRVGLHYIPAEEPGPSWKSVLVVVDFWPENETVPQLLLVGAARWSKPPQAVGAWNMRFFEERLGLINSVAFRSEPSEGVVSVTAKATSGESGDGFDSAVAFATPLVTLGPSNLEERVLGPLRSLLADEVGAATHALKATDHVAPSFWAGQQS